MTSRTASRSSGDGARTATVVIARWYARPVRAVTVLATGGTIAMRGEQATPALDGQSLVAAVPELRAFAELEVRSVRNVPGVHIGLADALEIVRAGTAIAAGGRGVVVTHGTDTL